MTKAELYEQVDTLLAREGAQNLLAQVLREAQLALTECGFKFQPQAISQRSSKPARVPLALGASSLMRAAVPMFDPALGHALELRATLFASAGQSPRGTVSVWLDAVACCSEVHGRVGAASSGQFDVPVVGEILARQAMQLYLSADDSLTDSQIVALLTSCLSGAHEADSKHDFAGLARSFAASLNGVLSA